MFVSINNRFIFASNLFKTMKKHFTTTLLLFVAVVFISSCRSKHGTCAAYAQAPVKKVVKHI